MARHATPEELGMASEGMVTHMEPEQEEVQTEVGISVPESDIEIEVVDDRTDDEKQHQPKSLSDEELKDVGARTQKRIKQLTKQKHDERRRAEAASRERDEAVAHARRILSEQERTSSLLKRTQDALNQQAVKRAEGAVSAAEQRYKMALETGDSDQIAKATKALTNATMAQQYAPQVAKQYEQRWSEEELKNAPIEERGFQPPPPQPVVPEPDERTQEWFGRNPWFGEDRVMTSAAYGIHEQLIMEEGVTAETDEYWNALDERLQGLFPSKYEAPSDTGAVRQATQATSQPAARSRVDTVVAPATRNNGAKTPQKIVLTESQVRIAKRLGVSVEDYARQVLKEQVANG